jgi:tRNA-specific 2-thiouridylase
MARVLVAVSGGVDSSVALALLADQGHDVVGAYMKNWINEEKVAGNCPWEEDIADARAVCGHLGVPFRVVNLMRDYRERVVRYLLEGYRGGVTPNPDVMCNREMKFGVLLAYALDEGFDAVATGHYAQRRENPDGTVDLLRGADRNKDQSYFLALLRQDQVRRALFPVGGLTKPEVRRLAVSLGLPNAGKKDSQGICFIGEVKMRDFLRTFVPDDPGDVVTVTGETVGRHRGLHLYTLGQRRGLGVASPHYRDPYVVVAKDARRNTLVVGSDRPETPGLYATTCTVGSLSWVNRPARAGQHLLAQPRYRTGAAPAAIAGNPGDARRRVVFDSPQRALTPGQICAFYDGEVLLGGSVFEEVGNPAVAPAPVTAGGAGT